MSGAFAPGTSLEPAALSLGLNASITPVRDALHRLAGERYVDSPRHEGFRVPAFTEVGLRDLYDWTAQLLGPALRGRRTDAPADEVKPHDETVASSTAALFLTIARATASRELALALSAAIERLNPARVAEHRFIPNETSEFARLTSAFHADDRSELLREIAAYHRVRIKIVPELSAHLMRHYLADRFS